MMTTRNTGHIPPARTQRFTQLCAAAAFGIALLTLAGWLLDARYLAGQWGWTIPMAPSTALAFLFLSGGVFSQARWSTHRLSRRFAPAAAGLVALLALLVVVQLIVGRDAGGELALARTKESLGQIPLGRMSPMTALALIFECGALMLLLRATRWRLAVCGAALFALLGTVIGLVVLVGYSYGAPLWYDGDAIPVALPTALAFLLLGVGEINLAQRGVPALGAWSGGSMRGALLRAFLPAMLVLIFFEGWLDAASPLSGAVNPALWHSLEAVVACVLIVAITARTARRVGDAIERAEEELRGSRALLQAVIEGTSDAIYAKDPQGRYLMFNRAAERFTGKTAAEVLGHDDAFLFPPADAAAVMEGDRKVLAARTTMTYEEEVTTAGGRPTTFFSTKGPLLDASGRPCGLFSIARDITERKRIEAVQAFLAQTSSGTADEPFFDGLARYLAKSLGMDFVCIDRLEGDGLAARTLAVWCDGKFEDNVTYALKDTPCGDVVGKAVCCFPSSVCQLFPRDRVLQDLRAESYVGVTLWSHAGRPIGLIAVIGRSPLENRPQAEATLKLVALRAAGELERLNAEEALRESAALAQAILDRMPCVALLLKPHSRKIVASNRAAALVGAVPGATCFGTWAGRDEPCLFCLAPQLWSTGKEQHLEIESHGVFWEAHWIPVSEDLYLHYAFDITARKRAEEERQHLQLQLAQSQKMESIGRLAGGVAHDFNNLLTVINGYSALALRRTQPLDPQFDSLTEILRAGERAAVLVRQLLAFSRKQVLQPEVIDLNATVSDMEKMLRRLVGEDIEIVVGLDPALAPVLADRHQIEQVIMNLAVNARDAMPDGGTLTLKTGQRRLEGVRDAGQGQIRPGAYVELTVRDTGMGMDEHTLEHVFEPFFTTKGVGQGTGLGLSTVQGIVIQSGGHVGVESEPGQGSAFHIYLPVAERPTIEASPLPPAGAEGGAETILLVEDQEEVRRFVAAILKHYGYRVVETADPDQAVRACASQPVDLLVTDVVMPKMSGVELARRARLALPGLRTLFISGYSEDTHERNWESLAGAKFLQKPFAPEALAAKVREVLKGR